VLVAALKYRYLFMDTPPTLEDFEKLTKANEELNEQLRERNETIKSLKKSGGDSEEIRTIVKEAVSAELKPLAEQFATTKKQNEELKATLAGTPSVAVSSGGSEPPERKVSKWTDEQLDFFKRMKIDPDKVAANVK
jgi:seryl-tRNA synthetase